MTGTHRGKRLLAGLTALAAGGGVGLQLFISSSKLGLLGGLWLDLLFFTILTNILVAVVSAMIAFGSDPQPSVSAATAAYIAVVAIIYHVLLQSLWHPQGAQYVADLLLHSASPLLFWFLWLGAIDKPVLPWRRAATWLVYPGTYSVYVLTRGAFTQLYPYPFIDVTKIGYGGVAINAALICLFFVLVGGVVLLLARLLSRPASLSRPLS